MRTRSSSKLAVSLVAFLGGAVACKGQLKPIEDVRDALVNDDRAKLAALPSCDQMGKGTDEACLANLATALGSKTGFSAKPPDQAAAGAVAVRIARDSRGSGVLDSPTWLSVLAGATGPGPDALRVAVASKLAANAAVFPATIDDEGAARRLLGVVGAAIPGACQLYTILGTGMDASAVPLAEQPAHSPCVQLDLQRSTGPGAGYGFGTFRAAEAALALARDATRALKEGAAKSDPAARPSLDNAIKTFDSAMTSCVLHKVISPGAGNLDESASAHAMDGGATPLGAASSTPVRDH